MILTAVSIKVVVDIKYELLVSGTEYSDKPPVDSYLVVMLRGPRTVSSIIGICVFCFLIGMLSPQF